MNETGKVYQTEQEIFWAGEFGTDYIERNMGNQLLASNLALFNRALRSVKSTNNCIELGANIGMNLKALKLLYPEQSQYAVEINPDGAMSYVNSSLPRMSSRHLSLNSNPWR